MPKEHNSSGCFQWCVVYLLRHPLHWAADQPCWCDWGHTHGFVVWVWCCQLSIHIHVLFPQVGCAVSSVQFCWYSSLFIACCFMPAPSDVKLCVLWFCTGMSQTVTFLHWRDGSSRLWTWLSARRNGAFLKRIHFGSKMNVCSITFGFSVLRIAMTRRQMYQRGEDQNKQTGFWGMIKSVTSTQTGSESILNAGHHIVYFVCFLFLYIICRIGVKALTSSYQTFLWSSRRLML